MGARFSASLRQAWMRNDLAIIKCALFFNHLHSQFLNVSHRSHTRSGGGSYSMQDGFRSGWPRGWAPQLRIAISIGPNGFHRDHSMRSGKIEVECMLVPFLRHSRTNIPVSARRGLSTNVCSSVTPRSRNSGSVAGSFAWGTNHGGKFLRSSKSQLWFDAFDRTNARAAAFASSELLTAGEGLDGWPHAIATPGIPSIAYDTAATHVKISRESALDLSGL